MPLAGCKELINLLEQKNPPECKVVVMPDFFLDRFINLTYDASEFSEMLADVAKRKGGSIDGIPQVDMRGGNAINVAAALASLRRSCDTYSLHEQLRFSANQILPQKHCNIR